MVQTWCIGLHQFWFVPQTAAQRQVERWRRTFGHHLRALREGRDLTQEALAERIGVDRKLIYRTELGQTSPRLDVVVQIAAALDVELAALVTPPGT